LVGACTTNLLSFNTTFWADGNLGAGTSNLNIIIPRANFAKYALRSNPNISLPANHTTKQTPHSHHTTLTQHTQHIHLLCNNTKAQTTSKFSKDYPAYPNFLVYVSIVELQYQHYRLPLKAGNFKKQQKPPQTKPSKHNTPHLFKTQQNKTITCYFFMISYEETIVSLSETKFC